MRGRVWWNKAHYGNESRGCCNNLYRKAACIKEGQCSITVIRDNNSVLKYEQEQWECWAFHCTCVETDSSFTPRAWLLTASSKACAIHPPKKKPSRSCQQHHHFLATLQQKQSQWPGEGVHAPYRSFSTLSSTKNNITRSLIMQMLNDYTGKAILSFLRNCKRMINHCLTFGSSWGICKKKFNLI